MQYLLLMNLVLAWVHKLRFNLIRKYKKYNYKKNLKINESNETPTTVILKQIKKKSCCVLKV